MKHRTVVIKCLTALLFFATAAHAEDLRQREERLEFQTQAPWSPRVDLNADVAMVYGIGENPCPVASTTGKSRGTAFT